MSDHNHPDDFSQYLDRMRAGDESAREELIAAAVRRLQRLASKMLRGFPNVKRWEDTQDVAQNALLRLDRALRSIVPDSSRGFMNLAAEMIRRELLDLARHYGGAHGLGKNHRSGLHLGDAANEGLDPSNGEPDPSELEKWAAFHAAVERLPVEEREVFMLVFYHKWPQKQIAELFQVDERTIRRWWQGAAQHLTRLLGGDLPGN
jgi:RNA polymerase sigma-70 factor (ECF subfamily)